MYKTYNIMPLKHGKLHAICHQNDFIKVKKNYCESKTKSTFFIGEEAPSSISGCGQMQKEPAIRLLLLLQLDGTIESEAVNETGMLYLMFILQYICYILLY
jgi:hypothetical protein